MAVWKKKKPVRIDVPRYDIGLWAKLKKSKPELCTEEWEEAARPWDVREIVENALKKMPRGSEARIITLDEEYEEWLSKTGQEDSLEGFAGYADTLNDADALRLFNKYEYNTPYDIYGLPVIASSEKPFPTQLRLEIGDEERAELEAYFESIFGDNCTYVPGYMLEAETFIEKYGAMLSLCEVRFREKRRIRLDELTEIRFQEGINLARLYIPVGIRLWRQTAVLRKANDENMAMLIREYPDVLSLERMEEQGLAGIPGVEELNCWGDIADMLRAEKMFVIPALVAQDDVPGYEMEVQKALRKAAKRQGIRYTELKRD